MDLAKDSEVWVNDLQGHAGSGAKGDHQLGRVFQILNGHNKIFAAAVESRCVSEHLHRPVSVFVTVSKHID